MGDPIAKEPCTSSHPLLQCKQECQTFPTTQGEPLPSPFKLVMFIACQIASHLLTG